MGLSSVWPMRTSPVSCLFPSFPLHLLQCTIVSCTSRLLYMLFLLIRMLLLPSPLNTLDKWYLPFRSPCKSHYYSGKLVLTPPPPAIILSPVDVFCICDCLFNTWVSCYTVNTVNRRTVCFVHWCTSSLKQRRQFTNIFWISENFYLEKLYE